MNDGKKTKFSINLLPMKIFCFVSSVSCIVFLIHNYSTNQGSFQNQYELWFLLIMVLGLLFYLFWMPEVSFDKSNLYIKKFNKTEIVSIKNAKSVHNDGKLFRGISSFRIKYLNKNNTLTEVKFRAYLSSTSSLAFVNTLTLTDSIGK